MRWLFRRIDPEKYRTSVMETISVIQCLPLGGSVSSFTVALLFLLQLQEEMNNWISAISVALSGQRSEVTPSSHSTPAPAARAQTLPATVATATAESSPGRRDKDKEKRFSLFSKKK